MRRGNTRLLAVSLMPSKATQAKEIPVHTRLLLAALSLVALAAVVAATAALAADDKRRAQTAATKVDFFTLVRGEDE